MYDNIILYCDDTTGEMSRFRSTALLNSKIPSSVKHAIIFSSNIHIIQLLCIPMLQMVGAIYKTLLR